MATAVAYEKSTEFQLLLLKLVDESTLNPRKHFDQKALDEWLARDYPGLDEAIDKAVAARWTAHRKAEAKAKPEPQTSAKTKKRAKGGSK